MSDTTAAAPHPGLFREFLHGLARMLPGAGTVAADELAAAIDRFMDEHDAAAPVPAPPAPEGTQP